MNKKDKQYLGYIFFLYFSIVAVKVLLTPLIKSPIINSDEPLHFIEASKIIALDMKYPPLYPFSISIAQQLFATVQSSYLATKVINCFLSTAVVFPAYFLSREFLRQKEPVVVALLSVIVPIAFIRNFFIQAENLFYPLFLLSVYLIIKAENNNSIKYAILGGLSIALTILTKPLGLVLVVGVLLLSIFKLLQREDFSKSGCSFAISLTILSPYLIYRGLKFGFDEKGLFSMGIIPRIESVITGINPVSDIVTKFISYFDYLVLASSIFFLIFSLSLLYYILKRRNVDSKLTTFVVFSWILVFTTLAVASIFLIEGSRIIGRYAFFLLPLVFIMGIKFTKTYNEKKNLSIIGVIAFVIPLMVFAEGFKGPAITSIVIYATYPVISAILISSIILLLLFIKLNIRQKRKILFYASILFLLELFILGNITAFQSVETASRQHYHNFNIGRYIADKNINATFDEDCFNVSGYYYWGTLFWSRGKIHKETINNTKNSHIISTKKLPHQVLTQNRITYPGKRNKTFYLYKRSEKYK